MTQTSAAQSVAALMNRERDLLRGIALTRETLDAHTEDLKLTRATLDGVKLGQALAAQAAAEAEEFDG